MNGQFTHSGAEKMRLLEPIAPVALKLIFKKNIGTKLENSDHLTHQAVVLG